MSTNITDAVQHGNKPKPKQIQNCNNVYWLILTPESYVMHQFHAMRQSLSALNTCCTTLLTSRYHTDGVKQESMAYTNYPIKQRRTGKLFHAKEHLHSTDNFTKLPKLAKPEEFNSKRNTIKTRNITEVPQVWLWPQHFYSTYCLHKLQYLWHCTVLL